MNEKLKSQLINLLKYYYKDIANKLNNLEKHVCNLYNLNLIDNFKYNNNLNNIYLLIKNLNSKYNELINNDDLDEIKNLVNNSEDLKINSNTLNLYYEFFPNKFYFKNIYNSIESIIKEIGYTNIKFLIKNTISYNIFNTFNNDIRTLIEEINDLTIPISFNIFEVINTSQEYYWRIPKKFNEFDYLEKVRELWIKIPNQNNKYIKIELIFKIDNLSILSKTSQLLKKIYYNKKICVLNSLENNNNIDSKFIKLFIKNDYIGNIYTLNINDYMNHVIDQYNYYLKLINLTFIALMKDFVSKCDSIKDMFNTIFLLLLGNDNDCELGILLIGLLKEKKNNSKMNLYNYMFNNMTFYLQFKIKKNSINFKNEIEKIKNITSDDIDYKKQLVLNKNIPYNVKNLVLEKIEEMKSFNNEYYKQLTYVKTIINYPWVSPNDNIFFNNLKKNTDSTKSYLNEVEKNLKSLCYGHDKAKNTLLQIIGKWISNPKSQGASLGLVGPPGVGKTLLAKSVSKALDIPFGQITLGGQNDGEILHGHGYTYSGSQPGMIIKKMVEMGKSRCILYFDELDKACSKHGTINEITSILIHLTDPNMNKSFQDRFFQGVDFPLNKVIIIFSYNDSSLIDPILLDRLKEIKVNPYTITDKINICQNYILPEILQDIKIGREIKFSNNILEYIIKNYTNEAGVRGIKRNLEDIILKLNLDKLYQRKLFKTEKSINVNKKLILEFLSKPKNLNTLIHTEPSVGLINGLYATTTGEGGIINIQIFKNIENNKDKFNIKLTGKQGDVMKESVQCSLTAALNYLNQNYKKYKLNNFNKHFNDNFINGFHVHCPSTSTPKDGPSAGCAFTCCFISRILNKPLRNDIGMTGEVELNGKVTKIGGLEFKLQGAKMAGVKTVYVSEENKIDIENITKKYKNLITKDFNVKLFNNISDIIDEILI